MTKAPCLFQMISCFLKHPVFECVCVCTLSLSLSLSLTRRVLNKKDNEKNEPFLMIATNFDKNSTT